QTYHLFFVDNYRIVEEIRNKRRKDQGGIFVATILIIEDHALSRQMLNTWLGYTGHTILKAGSGEEALAIARQKIPDLIISDILMPGMDGFELVRRLRREKR